MQNLEQLTEIVGLDPELEEEDVRLREPEAELESELEGEDVRASVAQAMPIRTWR